MNPIAVQTALLPGGTLDDQFRAAKTAGADGVELRIEPGFYDRLPEIADALTTHGLKAAALRLGYTRLIHPDYAEREAALVAMRHALAAAVDLDAAGVVFYGHYAPHAVLPDLHPYKSAVELEAELLVTMLRTTLCDLAYALGTQLLLAHADSTTSVLLRRPERAALIRAKLENHPHLHVAVCLAHLDAEKLGDSGFWGCGEGYICVCDTDGRLPGSGGRAWEHWAAALHGSGYRGWVTIEGREPAPVTALAGSIRALRRAGV